MVIYHKREALLATLFCSQCTAFQLSHVQPTLLNSPRVLSTQRYAISEWRDTFYECPSSALEQMNEEYHEGPLREICVLPFPLEENLLQGETKELCLYEDRFHQLFKRCNEQHFDMVAMGLMAPPSGMLQTMPLCEIENFRVMPGATAFGTSHSILATIRVVGRVSLVSLQDEDDTAEYLYGYCTEICDDTCSERTDLSSSKKDVIKDGNRIADHLEGVLKSIVKIESQVEIMDPEALRDNEGLTETQMKRRILEAELFEELDDDDDDETEEDDDDDDDGEPDRSDRFNEAFKIAKINDMQGYRTSSSITTSSETKRSVQDLTALSWAYFCTEEEAIDILAYRLQALDSTNLYERLKLALVMLLEKRSELKKTLKSLKADWDSDEER